tara:strand:- start:949 stop:2010 length:1062 start_codon:yes stop_codon:yes gene_type:complete
MKKVLFVYDNILHYRIPLFNILGEKYDFTVLHSGKKLDIENTKFNEVHISCKKIGPIFLREEAMWHLNENEYDILIFNFDLRYILELIFLFKKIRNPKIILWGAWLTKSKFANFLRLFFLKRYKSLFYCHESRMDFVNLGVKQDTTWVANNTIQVNNRTESFKYDKDIILSSGTLNARKKNIILINAFSCILSKIDEKIKLIFIGDGVELNNLKNLTKELDITSRVVFLGKILDEKKLISYFKRAYLSVSFGQAGLSILHSYAYGVPYITSKNAISGGEISNIKNEYNGFLTDDTQKSLEDSLLKLLRNINLTKKMGVNSYKHYSEYCTMENMSQGFIDIFENKRESKIYKQL